MAAGGFESSQAGEWRQTTWHRVCPMALDYLMHSTTDFNCCNAPFRVEIVGKLVAWQKTRQVNHGTTIRWPRGTQGPAQRPAGRRDETGPSRREWRSIPPSDRVWHCGNQRQHLSHSGGCCLERTHEVRVELQYGGSTGGHTSDDH